MHFAQLLHEKKLLGCPMKVSLAEHPSAGLDKEPVLSEFCLIFTTQAIFINEVTGEPKIF
ncbi:hypothetical protein BDE36_2052 [Arcticibacter tournemirensis]|nr:hypothetical protein BDE36_2052 [Arcticibacter tournemirensis]